MPPWCSRSSFERANSSDAQPPGQILAAYALGVRGDVDIPGIGHVPSESVHGTVEISSQLDEWPPEAAEPAELLFSQPDPSGREGVRLERTEAGYRMLLAGLAEFLVAADGTHVLCRPEAVPWWRWQRVLAGQALPMAALLQGIEVLHAGAVALETAGGRAAIGIAAGSHGGKSSLTVALALRGARLMTDDALAVELAPGGEVIAHPGIGAATLRSSEVERLRELGEYERLQVLAEEGDARVLLEREPAPVPLVAIYWPERDPELTEIEFVRLEPDPRRLLAGTINLVLRDPDRLKRHFEVSTAIAVRVPLFSIGVPPGVGASALAAAIEGHIARGEGEFDALATRV